MSGLKTLGIAICCILGLILASNWWRMVSHTSMDSGRVGSRLQLVVAQATRAGGSAGNTNKTPATVPIIYSSRPYQQVIIPDHLILQDRTEVFVIDSFITQLAAKYTVTSLSLSLSPRYERIKCHYSAIPPHRAGARHPPTSHTFSNPAPRIATAIRVLYLNRIIAIPALPLIRHSGVDSGTVRSLS